MSGAFELSEKAAVVTGGSKGLGLAMAAYVAEAGADVMIVSRHLGEGEAAAEAVRRQGRKVLAISADIREPDQCGMVVTKAVEAFGKLDILVNNAGVNIRKPLVEYTETEWDTVLDTNLKGLFFCSQAAAKVMMTQNRGRIINMSSAAAQIGVPLLGPYCASKGGVTQLTKVCALEWAGHGITVNAIGPTYIKTPLTEEWVSDPERYEQIIRRSAVKRLGETSDLRGVLLLLASDASDYITGQTFYVDGGSLAGWPIEW
ncbi:MAG: glucose 1-dehydrogenase [Deltaproteobacteria bacterium]|nr:glucose 1-dehydrogenase [Deltaproteobacteria bacterium]MBW1818258.1 glucose 1-dehydrogenase [Deltaproteobacteria bacterium]